MLPLELFTESAAFLAYYDLVVLKMTSQLCSYVARRCAEGIRRFDFSEFTFVVYNKGFCLFEDANGWNIMTTLARFTDDESAVAFISEAFRNCIFGQLELNRCSRRILEAIKNVASTVIVADRLSFSQVPVGEYVLPPSAIGEILDVVVDFRQVQKLEIISNYYPLQLIGVEHSEVAALCERKCIRLCEERTRPTIGFIH